MYVILSGSTKVYKTIDRKKIDLGVLYQDDFFGEMSLLLHLPRSATIEALEPTEVLVCDKDNFISLIREEPELTAQIITIMAKRLNDAHNVIIRLEGEKKSIKVMYGIE